MAMKQKVCDISTVKGYRACLSLKLKGWRQDYVDSTHVLMVELPPLTPEEGEKLRAFVARLK